MPSDTAGSNSTFIEHFRDDIFTPNVVSNGQPQQEYQQEQQQEAAPESEADTNPGSENPEGWYSVPIEGAIYQPALFSAPAPGPQHVARLGGVPESDAMPAPRAPAPRAQPRATARPSTGRAAHNASSGTMPSGTTPPGTTPSRTTPHGDVPYDPTPYGDTPYDNTPYADTPYSDTPYDDTPYGDAPPHTPPRIPPARTRRFSSFPARSTDIEDSDLRNEGNTTRNTTARQQLEEVLGIPSAPMEDPFVDPLMPVRPQSYDDYASIEPADNMLLDSASATPRTMIPGLRPTMGISVGRIGVANTRDRGGLLNKTSSFGIKGKRKHTS